MNIKIKIRMGRTYPGMGQVQPALWGNFDHHPKQMLLSPEFFFIPI